MTRPGIRPSAAPHGRVEPSDWDAWTRWGFDGPLLVIAWQRAVDARIAPVPWAATLLLGAVTWAAYLLDRSTAPGGPPATRAIAPLAVAIGLFIATPAAGRGSPVLLAQGVALLLLAAWRLRLAHRPAYGASGKNLLTAIVLVAGIWWPLPLGRWPAGPVAALSALFVVATGAIDAAHEARDRRAWMATAAAMAIGAAAAGSVGAASASALLTGTAVAAAAMVLVLRVVPGRPPGRFRVALDLALVAPAVVLTMA